MESLTTRMQHRPAMYTLTKLLTLYLMISAYALSAACVHSTYHTPNKEIVMGRC